MPTIQKSDPESSQHGADNMSTGGGNLDDLAASLPDPNSTEDPLDQTSTIKGKRSYHSSSNSTRGCNNSYALPISQSSRKRQVDAAESNLHDTPDTYAHLEESEMPSPIEIAEDEGGMYGHKSLEQAKQEEQNCQRKESKRLSTQMPLGEQKEPRIHEDGTRLVDRFSTRLYTVSYLIFFAILGTLARLGLQAITFYPGAPIVFTIIWPNMAGSLFMGLLSEDRMLFKEEWGTPTYHQQIQKAEQHKLTNKNASAEKIDLQAAKKAHASAKKTIPLYIGLATGFCGSFTSFSTFIRDAFLALSNALPTPLDHPADYTVGSSSSSTVSRNGGRSFMALLGVIIVNIAISIAGLYVGAHLAIASERFTPSLSYRFRRRILDRLAVFLGWGCWVGAIFLAIFPPDRSSPGPETWRGRATFAIVFAPLGCLGRFYASMYLNGKIASFPLGTFFVNVAGTAILGMCYDLQHVPLGGVIGCQVLQGIEDGFCGCLTTVSTWVAELTSLRRSHSYKYGAASVIVALCFLIVIMGSMQWTIGFSALQCLH